MLAALKQAARVLKAGGKVAEEIFERVGKTVKACTNCFVAGTLVATAVGLVPIEEIRAGDWVWARDEVTGEVRLCEVEETYRNESSAIVEVEASGETIATTPGHPFWVVDEGWKDAGDLEVGDHLVNLRGESVVVEDIRRRPVPEPVYNFSVAGLHTYFVGRGGVWVHNNSGPGCGAGGGHAPGKSFDQARREAFEKAEMTDPSKIKFTHIDPETGTVVGFKGEGGAKVVYDPPHPDTPGPFHDVPHVGYQPPGKTRSGARVREKIPYDPPWHPSRSPGSEVEPH